MSPPRTSPSSSRTTAVRVPRCRSLVEGEAGCHDRISAHNRASTSSVPPSAATRRASTDVWAVRSLCPQDSPSGCPCDRPGSQRIASWPTFLRQWTSNVGAGCGCDRPGRPDQRLQGGRHRSFTSLLCKPIGAVAAIAIASFGVDLPTMHVDRSQRTQSTKLGLLARQSHSAINAKASNCLDQETTIGDRFAPHCTRA